jgi:hypothetical protein
MAEVIAVMKPPAPYSRQAELRMMLQKWARLNFGSSSASTSSFMVPQVEWGLAYRDGKIALQTTTCTSGRTGKSRFLIFSI